MTVLECMKPFGPCSTKQLFANARWCNEMAKCADYATRRMLYEVKDACIAALLSEPAKHLLDIRGDTDRHRGLLSIGMRNQRRGGRLHFHENWLPAA